MLSRGLKRGMNKFFIIKLNKGRKGWGAVCLEVFLIIRYAFNELIILKYSNYIK